MSEWQDISTAPKDQWVLGAIIDDEGGYSYQSVHFDAVAEDRAYGPYGPYIWAVPGSGIGVLARDIVTHWMPLPIPPAPNSPVPS